MDFNEEIHSADYTAAVNGPDVLSLLDDFSGSLAALMTSSAQRCDCAGTINALKRETKKLNAEMTDCKAKLYDGMQSEGKLRDAEQKLRQSQQKLHKYKLHSSKLQKEVESLRAAPAVAAIPRTVDQDEKVALQSRIRELESSLRGKEELCTQLQTDLESYQTQAAKTSKKYATATAQCETLKGRLATANTKVARIEGDLNSRTEEVSMLSTAQQVLQENVAIANAKVLQLESALKCKADELVAGAAEQRTLKEALATAHTNAKRLESEVSSKYKEIASLAATRQALQVTSTTPSVGVEESVQADLLCRETDLETQLEFRTYRYEMMLALLKQARKETAELKMHLGMKTAALSDALRSFMQYRANNRLLESSITSALATTTVSARSVTDALSALVEKSEQQREEISFSHAELEKAMGKLGEIREKYREKKALLVQLLNDKQQLEKTCYDLRNDLQMSRWRTEEAETALSTLAVPAHGRAGQCVLTEVRECGVQVSEWSEHHQSAVQQSLGKGPAVQRKPGSLAERQCVVCAGLRKQLSEQGELVTKLRKEVGAKNRLIHEMRMSGVGDSAPKPPVVPLDLPFAEQVAAYKQVHDDVRAGHAVVQGQDPVGEYKRLFKQAAAVLRLPAEPTTQKDRPYTTAWMDIRKAKAEVAPLERGLAHIGCGAADKVPPETLAALRWLLATLRATAACVQSSRHSWVQVLVTERQRELLGRSDWETDFAILLTYCETVFGVLPQAVGRGDAVEQPAAVPMATTTVGQGDVGETRAVHHTSVPFTAVNGQDGVPPVVAGTALETGAGQFAVTAPELDVSRPGPTEQSQHLRAFTQLFRKISADAGLRFVTRAENGNRAIHPQLTPTWMNLRKPGSAIENIVHGLALIGAPEEMDAPSAELLASLRWLMTAVQTASGSVRSIDAPWAQAMVSNNGHQATSCGDVAVKADFALLSAYYERLLSVVTGTAVTARVDGVGLFCDGEVGEPSWQTAVNDAVQGTVRALSATRIIELPRGTCDALGAAMSTSVTAASGVVRRSNADTSGAVALTSLPSHGLSSARVGAGAINSCAASVKSALSAVTVASAATAATAGTTGSRLAGSGLLGQELHGAGARGEAAAPTPGPMKLSALETVLGKRSHANAISSTEGRTYYSISVIGAATEASVQSVASDVGPVRDVRRMEGGGYVVEFVSAKCAVDAVRTLDGYVLDDRTLSCKPYYKRTSGLTGLADEARAVLVRHQTLTKEALRRELTQFGPRQSMLSAGGEYVAIFTEERDAAQAAATLHGQNVSGKVVTCRDFGALPQVKKQQLREVTAGLRVSAPHFTSTPEPELQLRDPALPTPRRHRSRSPSRSRSRSPLRDNPEGSVPKDRWVVPHTAEHRLPMRPILRDPALQPREGSPEDGFGSGSGSDGYLSSGSGSDNSSSLVTDSDEHFSLDRRIRKRSRSDSRERTHPASGNRGPPVRAVQRATSTESFCRREPVSAVPRTGASQPKHCNICEERGLGWRAVQSHNTAQHSDERLNASRYCTICEELGRSVDICRNHFTRDHRGPPEKTNARRFCTICEEQGRPYITCCTHYTCDHRPAASNAKPPGKARAVAAAHASPGGVAVRTTAAPVREPVEEAATTGTPRMGPLSTRR
jgi:peptidoglycan hydrolase CwlO-like protein